jgi:DNA mismatch repair protein MutL
VTTEWGHSQEAFIRVALSRPGVHFTLAHDDRPVYEVPAAQSVLDRMGLFFGTDVANSLYALDGVQDGTRVTGYVADPSCDRSEPWLQDLFVNSRWVRDRGLFQAVQEAYAGLVMSGRYPAAFLFLDLPAGSVDVIAHPAKAEVRFRDRASAANELLYPQHRHGQFYLAILCACVGLAPLGRGVNSSPFRHSRLK